MKDKLSFVIGFLFGLFVYILIFFDIFRWLSDISFDLFFKSTCIIFKGNVFGFCGNMLTFLGFIIIPFFFGILGLIINYLLKNIKGEINK